MSKTSSMMRTILKARREKERRDRAVSFDVLRRAGHVAVMTYNDPQFIRVRIQDEIFKERRKTFPTAKLMARLQLAVAAGRSEKNMTIRWTENWTSGILNDWAKDNRPLGNHTTFTATVKR